MIPELLGYLLTGVECPTGWNGANIALLSGVWASAKPLSDRVGVVRGLVVVTTVSCRQLGTLSSLLPLTRMPILGETLPTLPGDTAPAD